MSTDLPKSWKADPARQGAPSVAAGDDLLSRAVQLQQAKQFEAAEDLYRRFLRTHPAHLVALNNAGLVAKALGKHDVALVRLSRAARRHPNTAETHFNLANTLQEMHRLDEAVDSYRRAIALRPDYAKAHMNLGNALSKLRRFEEATASYQSALACGGPSFEFSREGGETYCNLGNCFKEQGRMLDALVHFVCATRVDPQRADFHFAEAITHYEVRHHDDAVKSLRRVLELDPSHEGARTALMFQAQMICDWDTVAKLAPSVRQGVDKAFAAGLRCSEGAFDSLTRDADPARNHAAARSSALAFEGWMQPRPPIAKRPAGAPIRLGYLSGDFRDHPVAQVMGGVFGRHDRGRFHVSAYSYGPDDGSAWRRRIAADCDRFFNVERSTDDQVARRIREDKIDILVDLTLWTQGGRPRICSLRPSPVQVQYLGFPGTSGAPFYDYAIVDRTVVPPEERVFWSESLVFLPRSYFVTDRDQLIATTGLTRADCGLPDQCVVFCSFNQYFKIDAPVFAAWMRILAAVPDSVLWLPDNDYAPDHLRRAASAAGIAPDRLVFAPRTIDKAVHLERLALADIALDTLCYNGHTTTSDALWSGVPVIAMRGRHFASRVSASLLAVAELSQFVAENIDEYVELATRLALSPQQRLALRQRMAAKRLEVPLFDTDGMVGDLERAYETIWRQVSTGQPSTEIHL